MNRVRIVVLVMLTLAGVQAAAQPAPRIGLVLSGGGARGGAHLGVLQVLEELQVPVHVIVGTSAGAIVGGAYASGMPLDEIEAQMRPLHTALLFRDVVRDDLPMRRKDDEAYNYIGPEVGLQGGVPVLPKGAVAGVSLEAVLRRLMLRQRSEHFDQLPIPFRAVATDLTTAEMVVLERGSLTTAVRASMALPALVNPVEIDGRLLVDGGVTRNLPVDVARALGADVIIAVNIGTPMQSRRELDSLLSVADQMVRILTAQNVQRSLQDLRAGDVLITPDLGTVTTGDFDRLIEAATAGAVAARAAADRLEPYRVTPAAYAQWRSGRFAAVPEPARIDEIRVTGLRHVNPAGLRQALRIRPGQLFDAATADADIRRIYGTGDFERAGYFVSELPGGGHVLTADVAEKSWGPHYLRFGLGLSSDFDGNSYFNLLLTHRRTWLNSLGAEWRNDLQVGHSDRLRTEWHQPIVASGQVFAAASLEGTREPFDFFVDGSRLGRFRAERVTAVLDGGFDMGSMTELRAGVARGRVSLHTDTGQIPSEVLLQPTQTAGLQARLRFDNLDSVRFPRQGLAADATYYRSDPDLGATDSYGRLRVAVQSAISRDAHTLRAAWFESRAQGGGSLPGYEFSSLGGFLRGSGFRTGEFLAADTQLMRVVYTWRISMPGLLDGTYAGISAEHGRLNGLVSLESPQRRLNGNAVFVAADSPLGPVYLGLGRASSGEQAMYFHLGLP